MKRIFIRYEANKTGFILAFFALKPILHAKRIKKRTRILLSKSEYLTYFASKKRIF